VALWIESAAPSTVALSDTHCVANSDAFAFAFADSESESNSDSYPNADAEL